MTPIEILEHEAANCADYLWEERDDKYCIPQPL